MTCYKVANFGDEKCLLKLLKQYQQLTQICMNVIRVYKYNYNHTTNIFSDQTNIYTRANYMMHKCAVSARGPAPSSPGYLYEGGGVGDPCLLLLSPPANRSVTVVVAF